MPINPTYTSENSPENEVALEGELGAEPTHTHNNPTQPTLTPEESAAIDALMANLRQLDEARDPALGWLNVVGELQYHCQNFLGMEFTLMEEPVSVIGVHVSVIPPERLNLWGDDGLRVKGNALAQMLGLGFDQMRVLQGQVACYLINCYRRRKGHDWNGSSTDSTCEMYAPVEHADDFQATLTIRRGDMPVDDREDPPITVTEVHNILKPLRARLGKQHCFACSPKERFMKWAEEFGYSYTVKTTWFDTFNGKLAWREHRDYGRMTHAVMRVPYLPAASEAARLVLNRCWLEEMVSCGYPKPDYLGEEDRVRVEIVPKTSRGGEIHYYNMTVPRRMVELESFLNQDACDQKAVLLKPNLIRVTRPSYDFWPRESIERLMLQISSLLYDADVKVMRVYSDQDGAHIVFRYEATLPEKSSNAVRTVPVTVPLTFKSAPAALVTQLKGQFEGAPLELVDGNTLGLRSSNAYGPEWGVERGKLRNGMNEINEIFSPLGGVVSHDVISDELLHYWDKTYERVIPPERVPAKPFIVAFKVDELKFDEK